MNRPRRRDLFLLAALPLGPFRFRRTVPQRRAARVAPALKNEKEAAEAVVEIPSGTIPAARSGPFEGMRWQMRYYFDELASAATCRISRCPRRSSALASMLVETTDSDSLKSQLLLTRDNGKTWTQQKTEKSPLGVFVVGETNAWR